MPSLSVLHAPPSSLKNEAPALSSPPNPRSPDLSPATNHLNPTGTSYSERPSRAATRSIKALETMVLPTRQLVFHRGRWRNR